MPSSATPPAPSDRRILRHRGIPSLVALAVLLAVSVAVRVPGLGRPLGEAHDWITAQSLIALEILDAEGLVAHRFAIPQTFPGDANRYVRNAGIRLLDPQGRGYYTSFPPLSIIVPHLVFRLTGSSPTLVGLRVFSLVLHCIAAVFVFVLLRMVGRDRPGSDLAALAGAAVVLFLAPNLWYLCSTYSWDTFWHFLWAPWLVVALALLGSEQEPRPGRLALLGALTFALVYSELIGALCAATLAALLLARGPRRHRRTLGVLAAAVAAPLALTLVQYALLAGVGALRDTLVYAFQERSFLMASPKSRPQMVELGSASPVVLIARTYLRWFGPLLALLAVGAGLVAVTRRQAGTAGNRERRGEWELVVLTAVPILLHHAVLLQWTARHAYSVVKTSFLLAVLTALVLGRLLDGKIARRWLAAAAGTALLGVLVGGVRGFQRDFATTGDTSRYTRVGSEIARRVGPDQVVLAISKVYINPQIVHYARRNIQTVASADEARAWLAGHGRQSGVLVEIDRTPNVVSTAEVHP
ncbi:MAG: hypothetical protein MUF10_13020 [Thermoanaerobaculaceae bacterium]|jgi:hypothetical protein|nr:hypothetical protein [Thermoanaerobaculaceae bacterium]